MFKTFATSLTYAACTLATLAVAITLAVVAPELVVALAGLVAVVAMNRA